MAIVQSLSQTRVIDPILTTMAIGIKIPLYIGGLAFPPVFCPKRAATILSFGTKEEKFLYATRRARGANTMRISTGYGDTKVELYQDAIESELPYETLEESDGIVALQQRSVYLVKQKLCHRLEFDQLALLGNFAGYPTTNRLLLTGTNQFSDVNSPIAGEDGENHNEGDVVALDDGTAAMFVRFGYVTIEPEPTLSASGLSGFKDGRDLTAGVVSVASAPEPKIKETSNFKKAAPPES